jgi:hypothetical protein
MKMIVRPSFWAFNSGPSYAPPAVDLFRIPLARSGRRAPTTPAQIVHDFPVMAG